MELAGEHKKADAVRGTAPASALPPGQALTRKFPVTGEKAPLAEAVEPERWRLQVGGLVGKPLELTLAQFLQRAQQERVADIHCVTGWSMPGSRWTGLPLAELLREAGVRPEARFVRFESYSARGHDTSLPVEAALQDAWLVHAREGRALEVEHGGPVRTLVPSRYFYKSLKWVRRIELLAEDRLGYWERVSHYHNNGDWRSGQERYTTGAIQPERLAAFRAARDYRRHAGPAHLLLNVDLRGWRPASADLSGLHIKNSDLRGAQLGGANLSGANLTRCVFHGADLRGANLRGADLEGANFCGSDLTDADLRDAALSATLFSEPGAGAAGVGAVVRGMRWEGASGLLEEQEAYLLAAGTGRA